MHELAQCRQRNFRLKLLTSVSAWAVFAGCLSSARAEDTVRPTVWLELGGQLERTDGGMERFSPSFVSDLEASNFTSPSEVQRPPRYSTGFEGSLLFQPAGSNWNFTAAIRYGRSNRTGKLHQQAPLETAIRIASVPLLGNYARTAIVADAPRYADTISKSHATQTIVDFQVGRDVGLGLFGREGSSVVSAGVRIVQFESTTRAMVGGDFDFAFHYKYVTQFYGIPVNVKQPLENWSLNQSELDITRSSRGVGPSIAWEASASIIGERDRAELMFDWGLNAAVLFGRQQAKVHHETLSYHHIQDAPNATSTVTAPPNVHETVRSRSVTIPNVGGFAGFSLRFPNAKISMGYRADLFFSAVDGGIDARKTYDRNFYGPFAAISIGLGG